MTMRKNSGLDHDRTCLSNIHQICLDEASVAVYRLNVDGCFLETNKMASRQTGYSRQELSSMSIFDIEQGLSREKYEKIWRTVSENGPLKFESIFTRKNRTVFPVEITTSIVEFEGNEFAVSFIDDISDRKKTEEDLRWTQFSFENASVGIFSVDPSNGNILNANQMACDTLGYSKNELCAMSIFDIDPVFPKQGWEDHVRGLRNLGSKTIETIHQKKNGDRIPVEISINIMEFAGVEYHLAFVKDISERKQAENEKQKIINQLHQAQKLEAIGTLARGIAHDFNNILGAILGHITLAHKRCTTDSVLRGHIDQMATACMRARDLVRQVLTFSHQSAAEKMPVDIGSIVNEVISLLKASLPSSIHIHHAIPSRLGTISANPMQIHQLVMNLCTNACHAMEENGGTLKLDLRTRTITDSDLQSCDTLNPGEFLELIVSDSGHGMDKEIISQIFDPYFTTKGLGVGTGLGLSVVHGIVKELGGTVRVWSEPGVGTEFHLLFPVMNDKGIPSHGQGQEFPEGCETILFVDDEKALAELGKDLLEDLGYTVDIRSNGDDAIKAARLFPDRYDLLITDMVMPGMTGDELAYELRKITPGIRIIVSSGFSDQLTESFLEQAGIQMFLQKPIPLNELARAVRHVLDEKK